MPPILRRCVLVTCLLLARCSADPGARRAPDASAPDADAGDACPAPGAAWLAAAELPSPASPPAPGLPAFAVVATPAGDRVDLAPLARGAHPGLALAVDAACRLGVTPLAAFDESADPPPPRAPAAAPDLPPIGASADDPTLRALVVASTDPRSDPSIATDLARWDALLASIGARGRLLAAPTPDSLTAAIDGACASIDPAGGALVLAMLGPGAREPSRQGFLVAHELVPWRDLLSHLQSACRAARLVVWIVDSSNTDPLHLAPASTSPVPPILILAASDKQSPDAPRSALRGPAALTAALAAALPSAYAASCPGSARDLGNLAATFVDVGHGLHDAMIAARWQAIGAPALASLPSAERDVAQPLIAVALAAGVPTDLVRVLGTLPAPARCAHDADCGCAPDPGDAASVCQRYRCAAGRCVLGPDVGAACDDHNACTLGDHCEALGADGRCVGDGRPCDDGNPCTRDDCDPLSGCTSTPEAGGACDDGDPCTVDDTCRSDASCRGSARDCDDGDPCTRDTCDPLQASPTRENPRAPCVSVRQNAACDDGDPCTTGDQCMVGVCLGVRTRCDDGNPCTFDACDPVTGACHSTPLPNGATCDDGDACTVLDRCQDRRCVGSLASCDDGLACTFDVCQAGACQHLPSPGTCLTPSGCIPLGAHPPLAPCMVCAATDRLAPDPALAGAACPDDGIACTEDVCDAGVCRHRDAPDGCHLADGACVARGAPLGECLVCAGGGVATPLGAGTPCGGPAACAYGACDGAGSCALPVDAACCPELALTCGASTVLGTADVEHLASRVDQWTCAAAATPGPERAVRVTAACTGTVHVDLQGPPGALLVGGVRACPDPRCVVADPAHLETPLAADEVFALAVELPQGALGESRWVLTTRCDCD